MDYSRRYELFDGLSATSSDFTSNAIFWGDYEQGSVQWADGGNSILTVQSTNEDGFNTSLTTWSNLTGITAAGIYTIDAGPRWLRTLRNSADSMSQVYIEGKA